MEEHLGIKRTNKNALQNSHIYIYVYKERDIDATVDIHIYICIHRDEITKT